MRQNHNTRFQRNSPFLQFHANQDLLQKDLFELSSKLKLFEQLQTLLENDKNDPEIRLQLDDAKQVIKNSLIRLNGQGVSTTDLLSQFGDQLMQAKILEARYLIKRFGKPHNDFVSLFRENAEFEKIQENAQQEQFKDRIFEASVQGLSKAEFEKRVSQLIRDEMQRKEPIDVLKPQLAVDRTSDPLVIDAIEESAKIVKDNLEPVQVVDSEAKRVEEAKVEMPEPFVDSAQNERSVELNEPRFSDPVEQIRKPSDMIEYLHEQKHLNRKQQLKSKRKLDELHGLVSGMRHLNSEQKLEIRESLNRFYENKKKDKLRRK